VILAILSVVPSYVGLSFTVKKHFTEAAHVKQLDALSIQLDSIREISGIGATEIVKAIKESSRN
jgi:hypothetical protein